MTFRRVLRADIVAMLAAFALLFVMALDWYSNTTGEEARRQEKLAQPQGATAGEIERRIDEDAAIVAENAEKNAWQIGGVIDRLILVLLLATVALAIGAAYVRAAGKRFQPPLTPSGLAAALASVSALLIAYRIIQEPGFDEATVVEAGAPLALVVLAVIALACRSALAQEEAGTAWREDGAAPDPSPPA